MHEKSRTEVRLFYVLRITASKQQRRDQAILRQQSASTKQRLRMQNDGQQ